MSRIALKAFSHFFDILGGFFLFKLSSKRIPLLFFYFPLLFFVAKTIDAANLIQKGTVRLGSLAEKSNSVLSHAISFFS